MYVMKYYNIIIENKELQDFNPVMFGCDSVIPEYSCLTMRDYYLMHYVVSGSGKLSINGDTFSINRNHIFLIKPEQLVTYTASSDDPWSYIWIGFVGKMAEKFRALPPVIDYHSNVFHDMLSVREMQSMQIEFLAGKLFQLYTELFQNQVPPKYSIKVKNFIDTNYMTNIRIDEIAHDLNLNREYLSRCFKREMGLSIQEYLIRTRLNKACELLKKGISIQKVSNLVGYNDQFAFSKIYKKYIGICPSASQNENNNS